MNLKVKRGCLHIIPQNEMEEAYIEEILGLKKEGDKLDLVRINVSGLSSLAYLTTAREK